MVKANMRFNSFKKLFAVVLSAAVTAGTAFSAHATVGSSTPAVADVSMDAVAPWVQMERYIPVYVDGKLAGYIVHTYWVWVPDSVIVN